MYAGSAINRRTRRSESDSNLVLFKLALVLWFSLVRLASFMVKLGLVCVGSIQEQFGLGLVESWFSSARCGTILVQFGLGLVQFWFNSGLRWFKYV